MGADELRLGQAVRRLREQRSLSMKRLGEQAQVSESFISQVERGVANPSVASLRRIAGALSIPVATLFDGPPREQRVVRAAERRRLTHPQREWQDFLLTPGSARSLQVILSVIEPGAGSGSEPYSHESDEECVLVLKGALEFGIADETYLLEEGDSITFESRIPHWNRNPNDTRAEIVWILTPPSY